MQWGVVALRQDGTVLSAEPWPDHIPVPTSGLAWCALPADRCRRGAELVRATRAAEPQGNAMAKLTAHQRRALEMLACGPLRGSTEASLRSHGFDKPMLADLVHAGLACRTPERVRTGRRWATIAYCGSQRRACT